MEAGFGSEQTFFKTFRAATGISPKEWMAQIKNQPKSTKID
jgi:AraC-like DNA-binding protein